MNGSRIDEATAKRMGYDGIVAAETIEADNLLVEMCLIAPGHMSDTQYSLAVHVDCDPKHPTRGSSSMEDAGPSEADALRAYDSRVAEMRAELGLPAFGPR